MAVMNVEVIDDDEVVITYSGLEDGQGYAIEDVVIRVQSYEDTDKFRLGMAVTSDSRINVSLSSADDIDLEFNDIPNPFLDEECDECDDDIWDFDDDEDAPTVYATRCEECCEVCAEDGNECCQCGYDNEPICETEGHCCISQYHPCCNCDEYAKVEDMEIEDDPDWVGEHEQCDHCSDYYQDAPCCFCDATGPWWRK